MRTNFNNLSLDELTESIEGLFYAIEEADGPTNWLEETIGALSVELEARKKEESVMSARNAESGTVVCSKIEGDWWMAEAIDDDGTVCEFLIVHTDNPQQHREVESLIERHAGERRVLVQ